MNIAKQTSSSDCALFALTNVTCLAMMVDPLAVVFDQQQLRQHLISHLKTGQRVPCHSAATYGQSLGGHLHHLNHAMHLLPSNRKIGTPGTSLVRCCTPNDSSSWHAVSLSWPSTMWVGSCGRLSLVPMPPAPNTNLQY